MGSVARFTPKQVALNALRYGIGVATLWWVLSQVSLTEVASLLGRLDAPTIGAIVLVSVAGVLARFYTWHVVLNRIQSVAFRAAGSTDLMVNFVNQLLPSRLSGRIAAPFVLRSRVGMSYADAAAVSGVHTGIYAVLYGATAAVGIAFAFTRLSEGMLLLLGLSTALYAVAGAFVLLAGMNLGALDRMVESVERLLRWVPRVGSSLAERVGDASEFTAASTDAFRALARSPRVWLGYAAGWTVALVVAPGVRVWLLLGAFGVSFEPAVLLPVYLVMAYSVTLLPLTPGSIGVTEATATVVFVALGVPSGVIVPVIFIDRFLGVYLPALGGWYPSLQLDLSKLSTGEKEFDESP